MTKDKIVEMLELLKTDVINSMQANDKFVTGQTEKQITVVAEGNSVQLQLPEYMLVLETGRGPTSKDAATGNPSMIQRIHQWCRARGIPDKAAWAIKKSIDKKGYPGKPGIFSGPLGDDNINLRLEPVLDDIASIACDELVKSLA
ncbi:MAG TPA: hypothetical protein VGN20_19460 [Mucilaginibacter sp.]|jgi:hypothetical protein